MITLIPSILSAVICFEYKENKQFVPFHKFLYFMSVFIKIYLPQSVWKIGNENPQQKGLVIQGFLRNSHHVLKFLLQENGKKPSSNRE